MTKLIVYFIILMEEKEKSMEEILHILLHALKHSLVMLPLLAVVYVIIEYLEYKKYTAFENSKLLKGNASPIFGAIFGCVPQCGFSVISTDLYATKKISIGALVAVYISTSDEALPIMLASVENIPWLIALIATKLVLALAVGYLAMWLYPLIFKKNVVVAPRIKFGQAEIKTVADPNAPSSGCCNHNLASKKFTILHPILHSLKIFAFILAINVAMETLMFFVGEDKITEFLLSSYWFQPAFSVLVGLIPNCASSVILTNLFISGALSFGSVVAGLSVNAGLAIMILLKKNRPQKENVFIIGLILACSLIAGYLLQIIIPFN